MKGGLTDGIVLDDPEDTALGDALLSVMAPKLLTNELRAVEFVRMVSNYQISEALDRGEKNINILDE